MGGGGPRPCMVFCLPAPHPPTLLPRLYQTGGTGSPLSSSKEATCPPDCLLLGYTASTQPRGTSWQLGACPERSSQRSQPHPAYRYHCSPPKPWRRTFAAAASAAVVLTPTFSPAVFTPATTWSFLPAAVSTALLTSCREGAGGVRAARRGGAGWRGKPGEARRRRPRDWAPTEAVWAQCPAQPALADGRRRQGGAAAWFELREGRSRIVVTALLAPCAPADKLLHPANKRPVEQNQVRAALPPDRRRTRDSHQAAPSACSAGSPWLQMFGGRKIKRAGGRAEVSAQRGSLGAMPTTPACLLRMLSICI